MWVSLGGALGRGQAALLGGAAGSAGPAAGCRLLLRPLPADVGLAGAALPHACPQVSIEEGDAKARELNVSWG